MHSVWLPLKRSRRPQPHRHVHSRLCLAVGALVSAAVAAHGAQWVSVGAVVVVVVVWSQQVKEYEQARDEHRLLPEYAFNCFSFPRILYVCRSLPDVDGICGSR